MSIFESIFLGIVQGLTEFLPISSSGHLVLFQRIMNLGEEGLLAFDIIVHLATALAVITALWADIHKVVVDLIESFKALLSRQFDKVYNEGTKLALLIVAGCVPTFLIAIFFEDFFEELYITGRSLGIEFIATGILILLAESFKNKGKGIEKTSYADSMFIGVMQGAAILPAISRSGTTIAGALMVGLNREFAAKFSFLISLPVILGAGAKHILELIGSQAEGMAIPYTQLSLGFIAALVSGYIAVKFMLRIISKGNLKGFAYYVFGIGGLVLLDQIVFNKFFIPLW